MKKEIAVIKKEEAYTYDELDFLEEKLLPFVKVDEQRGAVRDILQALKASLENQKTSAVVFFMPRNTFNIFSLIQGDNSICKIAKEDVEALYKGFDSVDEGGRIPVYNHLKKKVQTLNDYLCQGNEVTPTVIAADDFSVMEIE